MIFPDNHLDKRNTDGIIPSVFCCKSIFTFIYIHFIKNMLYLYINIYTCKLLIIGMYNYQNMEVHLCVKKSSPYY